jgi:hypothetical protein
MKDFWRFFIHFFPVQLLLLHLRRSWLLLGFWFLLFAMVGGFLFEPIGIPYLFKTPEYLGDVNFLSFFIVGVVLGFFVMAFHITSYVLYSAQYTFLATTSRPLYRFSVNNSIIPTIFYGYYAYFIAVGLAEEGFTAFQILLNEIGLFLGSIVSIFISFTYFFSTIRRPRDKDESRVPLPVKLFIRKDKTLKEQTGNENVFTYMHNYYKIRRVRPSGHYDDQERLRTLQQHHTNAAIYFIVLLVLLILLGIFSDNRFVMIPAGASLVLIGTTYLMIFGALFSWLKAWTVSILLMAVIVLNIMSGMPQFTRQNKLVGLDYTGEPIPYSYEAIAAITTDSILDDDRKQMIKALEGWKARQSSPKPKLVIFNSSGGGLRSTLFTFGCMQYLDSITHGGFHSQVFMINGSSGGMIGAAYYRELHLHRQRGERIGINGKPYYNKLGADILNAVGFTMAVNDLFFPLKHVTKSGQTYSLNRGIAWDRRFNQNTDFLLEKPVNYYANLEQNGNIPLLVLSPTIINRGQRLLISPMGLSFLSRHNLNYQTRVTDLYDGVEFNRYFASKHADSISFVSALRMSSTFPYITPMVAMPTEPKMEIIDAGARDNDGLLLTIRFLHNFKDWIYENTSGVLLVQALASRPVEEEIKPNPYNTRLENLFKPLGSMVSSFMSLQGFARAEMLGYAEDWVDFPLDVVQLDLLQNTDKVSMSWHLTAREKKQIYQTIRSERLAPHFITIEVMASEE